LQKTQNLTNQHILVAKNACTVDFHCHKMF